MKTCPQCNAELPDGNVFCQRDGAILIDAVRPSSSGAAAMPARDPAYPSTIVSMPVAPTSPLAAAGEPAPALTIISAMRQSQVTTLLVIGAATILAVAAVLFINLPSAKRAIVSEIRRGNLVQTGGNSAYDLYIKHKSHLSDSEVNEITEEAAPAAESRANQIMSRLRQEGNESEAEWAEAIRLYSWLNEMRPKPAYESRRYFSQARLEFMQRNYSQAIVDYQRASQLDSTWAMPLNGLGRTYINMKDRLHAGESYRRATEIEPGWIYPWINLGALYLEANDFISAEQMLRQALQIDERKPSIHYLLAQVFEKTRRKCDALTEYRNALDKARGFTDPGFNLEFVRKRVEQIRC
ncbi:MAG: hypothetical protein V7641_4926 [Blastocatellia bacterium]